MVLSKSQYWKQDKITVVSIVQSSNLRHVKRNPHETPWLKSNPSPNKYYQYIQIIAQTMSNPSEYTVILLHVWIKYVVSEIWHCNNDVYQVFTAMASRWIVLNTYHPNLNFYHRQNPTGLLSSCFALKIVFCCKSVNVLGFFSW